MNYNTEMSHLMTIGEIINLFLESLAANGRSPETIATYTRRFRRMHTWPGLAADVPAADVTPEAIDRWAASIRANGLAPASILAYIQTAKTIFGFANRRGFIPSNPGEHLQRPRLDHSAAAANKCMTLDDLHAMIEACQHTRDLAILMLMADSGARRSEIAQMRISDLILDSLDAWVWGKSQRRELIDYTAATAAVLRDWLEQRPAADHDALFISFGSPSSEAGAPITAGAINCLLHRLARRAGVDGRANPHSIRHLVGQRFTDNVNLELVRQKLRHANINTTAMFYSHQDRSRVKAATTLYSPLGADE